MMFAYDWISIPLVYTQVVTIATYTYFFATLMGRQYLDPSKGYTGHEVDLYIPVFTVLEFFFFMGWLKVAEQLINPYGEDDDDFELNWCLDRNLLVSYWIVDEMHNKHPKLVKDMYWDEAEPILPYTKSSFALRNRPHLGSAMNLDIDLEEAEFVPMETIMEEDKEQLYASPPPTPLNDQMYIDVKDKEETLSQSKLMSEMKGSKLKNMIIGQSCESVSQLSNRINEKNVSLMLPFLLRTPQKRNRTISMAEAIDHGSNRSQKNVSTVSSQVNYKELAGRRFGDIPTAPVILNNYKSSPTVLRKETQTPLGDGKLGMDEEQLSANSDSNVVSRFRASSVEDPNVGFKFPPAYVPPKNPSEYYPQHLVPFQDADQPKFKKHSSNSLNNNNIVNTSNNSSSSSSNDSSSNNNNNNNNSNNSDISTTIINNNSDDFITTITTPTFTCAATSTTTATTTTTTTTTTTSSTTTTTTTNTSTNTATTNSNNITNTFTGNNDGNRNPSIASANLKETVNESINGDFEDTNNYESVNITISPARISSSATSSKSKLIVEAKKDEGNKEKIKRKILDDCISVVKEEEIEKENEQEQKEDTCYEANSSEESLSLYQSNQSTVTSITELLKHEKADN